MVGRSGGRCPLLLVAFRVFAQCLYVHTTSEWLPSLLPDAVALIGGVFFLVVFGFVTLLFWSFAHLHGPSMLSISASSAVRPLP